MAKYRIAIIGFGKIARDQHAPAIAASPDFELVAVSSRTAQADVPVFADYAQILRDCRDLDAVAVCTPPGPRRAIAAACLRAGKHVLLEKPPAGTVSEANDIAACAAQAGRVIFATYHAQHNEAVRRARERLAGKTVKALRVTWKEDLRRWHPGQDWILAAGGFGVFDPGINALSILTCMLPEPIFIKAAELFFPQNRAAPIAANLSFVTASEDGETLRAELDWRETGSQTWEIALETADGLHLVLGDGGARLQVDDQPSFVAPSEEYPDIYREFAERLRASRSQVDTAPFQLVADAFMVGRRIGVEPFDFEPSPRA